MRRRPVVLRATRMENPFREDVMCEEIINYSLKKRSLTVVCMFSLDSATSHSEIHMRGISTSVNTSVTFLSVVSPSPEI